MYLSVSLKKERQAGHWKSEYSSIFTGAFGSPMAFWLAAGRGKGVMATTVGAGANGFWPEEAINMPTKANATPAMARIISVRDGPPGPCCRRCLSLAV